MQDLVKNSTLTPQKSVSSSFFCNVALAGWLYPGDISEFIYSISGEIFADSENSDEIYDEVAHKQTDSG